MISFIRWTSKVQKQKPTNFSEWKSTRYYHRTDRTCCKLQNSDLEHTVKKWHEPFPFALSLQNMTSSCCSSNDRNRFLWLFPGWFPFGWWDRDYQNPFDSNFVCTRQEMKKSVQHSFTVAPAFYGLDNARVDISDEINITVSEWRQLYHHVLATVSARYLSQSVNVHVSASVDCNKQYCPPPQKKERKSVSVKFTSASTTHSKHPRGVSPHAIVIVMRWPQWGKEIFPLIRFIIH